MKIAILSMQEVKNYGSFLQAFSLKKNIEALGHECDFINIIPGEQIGKYRRSKFHKIKLLAKRLCGWNLFKRLKYIYKFQSRFSKEFLPILGVELGKVNMQHYDVVVIGSDEVFNCAQKTWFGFSPQLFGEGLNADKVITYAASFGATDTDKLERIGIKERVANAISNISAISVRDENSYHTIKELLDKESTINVDPVLIFDYTEYMPQSVDMKNYMIVYTYPGRITDKHEISAIRDFARSKGLTLVSIGHFFPWVDKTIVPSPFEVLAYFKNADYIVTDTFHGSVFSLKYNKQFCTLVRDMNSNKLHYLLKQFYLTDRIAYPAEKINEIMDNPIDYGRVNDILAMERERSMGYLRNNLN